MQSAPHLHTPTLIAAFEVMLTSPGNAQTLKQADTFIQQAETHPQFALTLMRIYTDVPNPRTQLQILIHLKNVIKRNWTSKRRGHEAAVMTQEDRQRVKSGLVEMYKAHWRAHYKEFNEIFKFLAKYEFPANYPELQQFILQILGTLSQLQIQSVISPPELLPYLSLIKCIFKQNSNRRYLHSKQLYHEHIHPPLTLALALLHKLDHALRSLHSHDDVDTVLKLLECSRKIDKIVIYCLSCAVSVQQSEREIAQIVEYLVGKVDLLLGVNGGKIRDNVELDIMAIVEGIGKLQTALPFLFTNCLDKYMRTLLALLFNHSFASQQLNKTIVIANSKILTTFAYYSTQAQFQQSIEYRKGTGANYSAEQSRCHQQFVAIYGGGNTVALLERLVGGLMTGHARQRVEDQAMFEDGEAEAGELGVFELLLVFVRNVFNRFKEELKGFATQLLTHVLNNKLATNSSPTAANMYELIMLLPKIYDQPNLQLPLISDLLSLCYSNLDFGAFSRLVRAYNSFFSLSMVTHSFDILINIMSTPNVNHQVMYQCAVCIKKILNQHQEQDLPVGNLGLCVGNLLALVAVYKRTPSHMWNLLQLVTDILRVITPESVMANLATIVTSVDYLLESKDNQGLTIEAIADLLQGVLELVLAETGATTPALSNLYGLSIRLVSVQAGNSELQNPDILYRLWLSVVKKVHVSSCDQALRQKLVAALQALKQTLIQEDPALFVEIVEEYMLSGLFNFSQEDLVALAEQILAEAQPEHKNRMYMAIVSLYFTYYLTAKTYVPRLVLLCLQVVSQLKDKISQETNLVRTFVMLVLNHHIIEQGAGKMFGVFTEVSGGNYESWLVPYLWSLEYLSHKYACKLASIAMLSSLQVLQSAQILLKPLGDTLPLLKILKSISFQVEPMTHSSALNSYMNAFNTMLPSEQRKSRVRAHFLSLKQTPRKYRLHIVVEWVECDLAPVCRDKLGALLAGLGWGLQDIEQKFDALAAMKIKNLLTGNTNAQ